MSMPRTGAVSSCRRFSARRRACSKPGLWPAWRRRPAPPAYWRPAWPDPMRPLSLHFERNVRSAKLGHALLVIGCRVTALVIGAQAIVYRELQRQELATPAAEAK